MALHGVVGLLLLLVWAVFAWLSRRVEADAPSRGVRVFRLSTRSGRCRCCVRVETRPCWGERFPRAWWRWGVGIDRCPVTVLVWVRSRGSLRCVVGGVLFACSRVVVAEWLLVGLVGLVKAVMWGSRVAVSCCRVRVALLVPVWLVRLRVARVGWWLWCLRTSHVGVRFTRIGGCASGVLRYWCSVSQCNRSRVLVGGAKSALLRSSG